MIIFPLGKPADILARTDPDWAPTVDMGHDNIKNTALAIARNVRATRRNKQKVSEQSEVQSSSVSQLSRE